MKSTSRSARDAASSSDAPYSVGTMPDLPRTRIGSFSVSRSLRSAVLIAGWVWFSRSAACVTLRSSSSVRNTRTSQMSSEAVRSSSSIGGGCGGRQGAVFI